MTDPNAAPAEPNPNDPPADPNANTPPAEPTPEGERTWFGEEPPADPAAPPNDPEPSADPATLPDDGRQLPEWVPGEYHDPARRAELLEALGFKSADVDAANRPEWLPEKFTSAEELAKSYTELEKKLGGRDGPPDQYEIEMPEGAGELTDEDAEAFREMGLSNDAAQKAINYIHENVVPQMREQQTALEQQQLASAWGMTTNDGDIDREAMKSRLAEVKKWADKNVPEGVVKELSRSSSGVQQLYNLMASKTRAAPAPTGASTGLSEAQIQQMVNDPRYWSDPAFQQEVNEKVQAAHGGR